MFPTSVFLHIFMSSYLHVTHKINGVFDLVMLFLMMMTMVSAEEWSKKGLQLYKSEFNDASDPLS